MKESILQKLNGSPIGRGVTKLSHTKNQHARQITISLRNEDGDVVLARQVSTQPKKINEFFERLTRERLRSDESFIATLEVCGFNDWLIRMLQDYRCQKVILIQPEERKNRKTSGASRRNGLGAIARLTRTIATSRCDDDRD